MKTIHIDDNTYLLVLTGAGVSAESGIPTFRDSDGLWENYNVEDVATIKGFNRNPKMVWDCYSQLRKKASKCQPNAGHKALAELEKSMGDRFLLATQNVDMLHSRAGNKRVLEIHGNVFKTKCTTCDLTSFADERAYSKPPKCKECDSLLRPDVVWFGETLNPEDFDKIDDFIAEARAKQMMGSSLVFLAVGTSGAVFPAAGLVTLAKMKGAETWLVNSEPADNISNFDNFVQGTSAKLLPELFHHDD